MNFYKELEKELNAVLKALSAEDELPADLPFDRIAVEPPRDPAHGDVATNAAMILADSVRRKPRDIAGMVAARLRELPVLENVEVAGPGFINMRLSPEFWQARLREILNIGTAYGDSDMGGGEKVNVEYVSANPTGPMHVGHGRGAVVGDVLASLLSKAGYDVTREYYINDAGAQVDVLARSGCLRYREALGEEITIPEGHYPGEYLVPVGEEIAAKEGEKWQGKPEEEWLPVFREHAIRAMMDLIREDLAALGVSFDVFFSERELVASGGVDSVISDLESRDLIYEGVLDPPKGKKPEDWEARPQTLFRASDFGDDVDRPLRKSDGSYTYFATDIAYHLDKFRRGFASMIDVWGADHGGYVKRMQAAVRAITRDKGALDVKLCQLVNLLKNGEPVRMSKRAGTFVTLREVVDSVGRDVMRFIMLTRRNDAHLDFDMLKVQEKSRENPVFYVQYAYARAASVRRHAAELFPDSDLSPAGLANSRVSLLTHEGETDLIKALAGWPRMVETAALAHEPHRVAYYLYEVASRFHALWNMGRDEEEIRFLRPEAPELSLARLALVEAMGTVLASGLEVFGVTPVEEM